MSKETLHFVWCYFFRKQTVRNALNMKNCSLKKAKAPIIEIWNWVKLFPSELCGFNRLCQNLFPMHRCIVVYVVGWFDVSVYYQYIFRSTFNFPAKKKTNSKIVCLQSWPWTSSWRWNRSGFGDPSPVATRYAQQFTKKVYFYVFTQGPPPYFQPKQVSAFAQKINPHLTLLIA